MALTYKQEALRKLIHLSSFWIVGMIYFVPRVWSILILSALSAFVLISEYQVYKKRDSLFARAYMKIFTPVLRDNEKNNSFHLSGAPYVFVASLILVVMFSDIEAMFALSVLLISDTMAALVGRRFGRHKLLGKKTWEGTLAFLISGYAVAFLYSCGLGLSMEVALVGVLCGCLGDLFNEQIHVDDNLSIPLLTALPFLF